MQEQTVGTRDMPFLPEETAIIIPDVTMTAHWELTLLNAIPDATNQILAENQFNDPPEVGNQFYMVGFRLKWVGEGSRTAFSDLTFRAVGDSGVVYNTFDPGCGVLPDSLDTFTELFDGGTIEGNECWQIVSSDVDSLMVIVDVGTFNTLRAWFSPR